MKRSTPLLALVLALPLGVPLACSDDSIDAGSGGSGGASGTTGTLSTVNGATTTGSSTSTNTASGGGDSSGTAGGGQGSNGSGANGAGGNGSGAGAGVGGGLPDPTEVSECQGHIYECGDLVDNDQDGDIDYQDADCLGPCDDTEDSYFGGISGQAGPNCKVDCYFDQDSGAGNDDCHWDHRCDPLSVDPTFYPEPWNGDACAYEGDGYQVNSGEDGTCGFLYENQSDDCIDYCAPLVPNGCDCFGCCELPAGGGNFVWLGSEGVDDQNPTVCTEAEVGNPAVCHPCTPVQDECYNACELCEVCIGKPVPPPECFGGEGGGDPSGSTSTGSSSSGGGTDPSGGTGGGSTSSGGGSQCPDGIQACGLPGQALCSAGQYCVTGCCRIVPN